MPPSLAAYNAKQNTYEVAVKCNESDVLIIQVGNPNWKSVDQ